MQEVNWSNRAQELVYVCDSYSCNSVLWRDVKKDCSFFDCTSVGDRTSLFFGLKGEIKTHQARLCEIKMSIWVLFISSVTIWSKHKRVRWRMNEAGLQKFQDSNSGTLLIFFFFCVQFFECKLWGIMFLMPTICSSCCCFLLLFYR